MKPVGFHQAVGVRNDWADVIGEWLFNEWFCWRQENAQPQVEILE